jgi:hypothetical protein
MILPLLRPFILWFAFRDMIGQFATREPVARAMYRLARVRPGQRIIDPSCGDGIYLRCAPKKQPNLRL